MPQQRPPVRWLDPLQLLRTAQLAYRASVFAAYADQRAVMGVAPRQTYQLDPSLRAPDDADHSGGVWFDYLADTGDGYESTFAVAASVAGAPDVSHGGCSLDAECSCRAKPPRRPLPLLVMGGDQVYPLASVDEYEARLRLPFKTALDQVLKRDERGTKGSFLAAIPGNHDWYDGLAAFRRYFCETWTYPSSAAGTGLRLRRVNGRRVVGDTACESFAGWSVFQSRSYFAITLGEGWRLWGIDIQLDRPLDSEQLAYFRAAAQELVHSDDDLILCTARPSWVDGESADDATYTSNRVYLEQFIAWVLPKDEGRVRLFLSGDKHHYAKYQMSSGRQFVTCGCGGAFLASTAHLPSQVAFGGETSEAGPELWPDRKTSHHLMKSRFWTIPLANGRWYVALVVLIGAVLAWQLRPAATWIVEGRLPDGAILGVFSAAFFAILMVTYSWLTSPEAPWPKWFGAGLVHATAHLGLALALACGVQRLGRPLGSAIGLVGLVCLGPLIHAVYLWLAHSAGLHSEDAFSAMGIEDYKAHLSVHVTKEALHCHLIGMEDVSTRRAEHIHCFSVSRRERPGEAPTV